MGGRGCAMYVTLEGANPSRKLASGLVTGPLEVYVIVPRGFPRAAAKPSCPTLRTKSAPIFRLWFLITQVSVSPKVARYWLNWRSVFRFPLLSKDVNFDP